jgi:hypothetical protein
MWGHLQGDVTSGDMTGSSNEVACLNHYLKAPHDVIPQKLASPAP